MSRHRDLRGNLKSISSSKDLEELEAGYEEEGEDFGPDELGNGNGNRDDDDLIQECLKEFQRQYGRDTFSRSDIVRALRHNYYDVEQAMRELTAQNEEEDQDYYDDEGDDEYDEFGRRIRSPARQKSGKAPSSGKTKTTPVPNAPNAAIKSSPQVGQKTQAPSQQQQQQQQLSQKATVPPLVQSRPSNGSPTQAPSQQKQSQKPQSQQARGATIKKELEVTPTDSPSPSTTTTATKSFVPIVKKPDMKLKDRSKPKKQHQSQKQKEPSSAAASSQQTQKEQLVMDLESMGLSEKEVQAAQREEASLAASASTEEEFEQKPLRRVSSTASLPRSASNADLRSYKPPVVPPQEKDGKERVNIVVIGHVDAGKSTLMGHLLCKLGKVAEREIHKFEKESKELKKGSFMFAWVMDASQVERQRGITVDVSTTNFETERKRVTILDAPGHKDFVPNMISGAVQADVAILVVDSSRGEFEVGFQAGGQTKEHVILVRSLGVTQLLVAVNKLDNVGWSKDRFDEIKGTLSPFLRQTGFKDKDVEFVPCSGLSGENLISISEENTALRSWYPPDSPSIASFIDSIRPASRLTDKPLRMCVSDIFKQPNKGGTCVAGKIESGATVVSQKVICMPQNQICTVKYIERDGVSVQAAYAGENIVLGIDLGGIDSNTLSIGNVICALESPIPVTKVIKANLVVFDLRVPITKGQEVVFFTQCAQVSATITRLVRTVDKTTGQTLKRKPRCLIKNSAALVKIRTDVPVCVELYNNLKSFGRFTLRAEGNTIASGIITKIYKKRPPGVPKKNPHIRRHTAM